MTAPPEALGGGAMTGGGAGTAGEASGGAGEGGSPDFWSLIPQDGLALWLMADHGIGELDAGKVAVWSDFSVHEADAKQSISSLQPTLVPADGGGLPVVSFDGADDQLALPPGFADFSAGLSAFIVASQSSEQDCPSLLHLSNEPEQQDIEIGRLFGVPNYEVADDEVSGPDGSFPLGQRVLVAVTHAPGKAPELRVNGMFMATGGFTALPVTHARANNFIGRSLYDGCEPFHGTIGEVILYSRALSVAERDAVQAYLQGKWRYEPPVKVKPGPGEIEAVY
jgi:Concanavalin A-like lectin/glucanases superfamily